ADRERRPDPPRSLQQLLQTLELSLVVAQHDGGRRAGEQRAQPVEIPVHLLRREEAELDRRPLARQEEPRETRERRPPDLRLRQDGAPAGDVLAQTAGYLEVVLGLL